MTAQSPTVDIYEVVQAHLQPSEVIKIAARCKSQTPDAKTYLAVISNVQNDNDAEQAALLAVEVQKSAVSGKVTGILPIFSDYTFTIEQYHDGILGNSSVLEAAGKPMQASFAVKFSSNQGLCTLTAVTDDIASLGDLMQETKRLADIAGRYHYTANSTSPSHEWLAAYSITRPDGHPRQYVVPRKQESFSSMLASYGTKALEGLPPSLSSTLGSFSFLGAGTGVPALASPPALPPRPRAQKIFEDDLDEEMQSKLSAHREEFVKVQHLRVHVATFNANGQFYEPEQSLSTWLKPEEQPDILVVGLQEMDLRPEVLMVRHDTTVGHAWVTGILACLNNGADGESKKGYQCVEMKQLAGMYIACFADASLVKRGIISNVTSTSVMTGWAGFAGNKGACGIRLTVYDNKSLCFVSAHLAAFQDSVERRNADYKDICTRMIFPPAERLATDKADDGSQPDGRFYPTIFDSDVLFFFGDLNYRLDLDMSENKALLEKKAYQELLQHDQLKKVQNPTTKIAGALQPLAHAFEGFHEADIDFQPTYKYDKGTDSYDSSEKERKPAWTDRVLWYNGKAREPEHDSAEQVKVSCRSYTSAMDMRMSDHKPVMASFELHIPQVDHERRVAVLDELRKVPKLD